MFTSSLNPGKASRGNVRLRLRLRQGSAPTCLFSAVAFSNAKEKEERGKENKVAAPEKKTSWTLLFLLALLPFSMLQGDDHTLEDGIKSKLNLGDNSASLSSLPFPAKVYSFRLEASAQEAPPSSSPVDSLVVVFSNRVQVSLTSSGKPGIFLEVTANNAAGNQVRTKLGVTV